MANRGYDVVVDVDAEVCDKTIPLDLLLRQPLTYFR